MASLLAASSPPMLSATLPWLAQQAGQQLPGEYRLHVLSGSPPSVLVEAEVEGRDRRLVVATGGGIDHLPNQWATFVHDLRATDLGGRALALEPAGAEGWRTTGDYSGRVRLTYRVDLTFMTGTVRR